MTEEEEREASRSTRPQTDTAAWAVLGAASREKADLFLDRQSALSQLQMENLQLENKRLHAHHLFEVSHLRFRRFCHGSSPLLGLYGGRISAGGQPRPVRCSRRG